MMLANSSSSPSQKFSSPTQNSPDRSPSGLDPVENKGFSKGIFKGIFKGISKGIFLGYFLRVFSKGIFLGYFLKVFSKGIFNHMMRWTISEVKLGKHSFFPMWSEMKLGQWREDGKRDKIEIRFVFLYLVVISLHFCNNHTFKNVCSRKLNWPISSAISSQTLALKKMVKSVPQQAIYTIFFISLPTNFLFLWPCAISDNRNGRKGNIKS